VIDVRSASMLVFGVLHLLRAGTMLMLTVIHG
jgi:hypothetical protein